MMNYIEAGHTFPASGAAPRREYSCMQNPSDAPTPRLGSAQSVGARKKLWGDGRGHGVMLHGSCSLIAHISLYYFKDVQYYKTYNVIYAAGQHIYVSESETKWRKMEINV